MSDDLCARTRLGQLLHLRRWSQADFIAAYNRTATALAQSETELAPARPAPLSRRQAQRWISGETHRPIPAALRVLARMFPDEPVEELLGAPHPMPASTSPGSGVAGHADDRSGLSVSSWAPSTGEPDLGDVMSMAARESADFIGFAEQSDCGPHTLEQLWEDLHQILAAYPAHPLAPVAAQARTLRKRVHELLRGRHRPGQARQLYVLAAALSGVLSNASFDLSDFSGARTHARAALVAAEAAGHHGMRAWVRGMQALIAYWDSDYGYASELAADASRHSPANGTAGIRALCIEARARARLGDQHGTRSALRRADHARDTLNTEDEFGGMMAFPLAKQSLYTGSSAVLLGGPAMIAPAREHCTAAVTGYLADPEPVRRVGELALARLDLAAAYLAESDLDAAAEQLNHVIDLAENRPTAAVARRLTQLHAALERPRWQTSALTSALRDRIRSAPIQPADPSEDNT
ncbi:hypothetical protein [Nocardia farcinica]